jgi:carbonic anhydrase
VVFDEGHTLQVQLAPGSAIEIDGHAYQLLQFHFHMPSEHAIAGEHYPLELHLVHQDTDGRIAVVGVLYDTGTESKLLAELWSRWPRKVGGEDKPHKPFDPGGLLPETRTVFRYTGSLTTPPCTEEVMWNVMRRAMSDTKRTSTSSPGTIRTTPASCSRWATARSCDRIGFRARPLPSARPRASLGA